MSFEPEGRRRRVRAALCAWLVNIAIGAAIGTQYLAVAPPATTLNAKLFAATGLVSSTAYLSLIPAVIVFVAAFLITRPRVLGLLQAFVWTLFQLAVFVDTRIYRIFRYHFNGMVWNVMTTPGAEDSVELGPRTYVVVIGAAALFCVLAYVVWRRWIWTIEKPARLLRYGFIAVVACILVEKGLYASADLRRDRRVLAMSSAFWMYQPLTIKRLLSRQFGVSLAARPRVELGDDELFLRYPHSKPAIDPNGARPNVLILVIDSLRADALTPETMPATYAYAESARRFDDHISGGNCTRFGIFSLIYGIHGSYWEPVYEEQKPPVLVTTLTDLGYDLRVLSTASMSFPEFRSTCWVSIEDKVVDSWPSQFKHERDSMVGEKFATWMGERSAAQANAPFFCFVLLDSPHGRHSFPEDRAPFQPSAKSVDYLALADQPGPEQIRELHNSYKNAVLHTDVVVDGMLRALRESGELENTIVVITGDHGEEFMEHGYYGHTSNYTPEQVRVAFVMSGPGVPIGVETRPTSHLDVAPTILEMLGADPAARGEYSFGESLLAPRSERLRTLSGWDEMALWVPEGVLHIPLEGHKGLVEARDFSWRHLENEDEVIGRHGAEIARMARECRWFLR